LNVTNSGSQYGGMAVNGLIFLFISAWNITSTDHHIFLASVIAQLPARPTSSWDWFWPPFTNDLYCCYSHNSDYSFYNIFCRQYIQFTHYMAWEVLAVRNHTKFRWENFRERDN
jgi:hypothetical protein